MTPIRTLLLALIGAVVLAACSGAADIVDDPVTTLPTQDDVVEVVSEVQADIERLGEEVANSEAADELQEAWTDLNSELTNMMESIRTNQAFDTDAVENRLAEFGQEVEAAGEEVGDELQSAWSDLRSKVEQLLG
jgi:hypothetical protein